MRLLLTLVDGEEIEYIMENESVTIGRSSKCDLVIPHESMSRQHCKIELISGDIFITDMGSVNGVLIDGKKIPPNSSVPFQTYLHLAFGFVTGAQIIVDEQTRLGILNPLDPRIAKQSNETFKTIDTKAKNTTQSIRAGKTILPTPKKKPSIKAERAAIIIKGLSFIAVLIGIYFFLYADKDMSNTNSTTTKTNNEPF